MRKSLSPVLLGSGLALSIASSASAHISLQEPPPRYVPVGEVGIKSCPCGLGGSNRTCNVAQDGSDPDRSDSVSTFEAGSTITVRFNEFVNHSGRFRIAFDPDGADVADFNQHILMDVADPNNANNTEWEFQVKLPNETCENCTLQVVQAMNGDMVDPVPDPSTTSSYYACADITLVAPGTMGGNPSTPTPTPTPPPADAPPPPPDAPAGEEPAGDDGAAEGDEGSSDGAGESNDTPLIPTTPQPTDSMAASGTAAPTTPAPAAPSGMVAMNDMIGTAVTPTIPGTGSATTGLDGTPQSSSSSSGGCAIGGSGSSGSTGKRGAFGLATLGLLAAFGLRQRSRQAQR